VLFYRDKDSCVGRSIYSQLRYLMGVLSRVPPKYMLHRKRTCSKGPGLGATSKTSTARWRRELSRFSWEGPEERSRVHKDIPHTRISFSLKASPVNGSVHGNAVTCITERTFGCVYYCLMCVNPSGRTLCRSCERDLCLSEIRPPRHRIHLDGSTAPS
jgi:hypothetical protein